MWKIPMDFTETTLESRDVFNGRVIKVRVDRVRLPGGRESEREIVEHVGAVAVVPVDAQGRVYLVRQYRKALEQLLLEIPAGKLEPGEDPLECARRELVEEIGFYPEQMHKLAHYYSSPGFSDERIHMYLATELVPQGIAGGDGEELLEVVSLSLADALAKVALQEIDDGKTIAGLLLADRYLQGLL